MDFDLDCYVRQWELYMDRYSMNEAFVQTEAEGSITCVKETLKPHTGWTDAAGEEKLPKLHFLFARVNFCWGGKNEGKVKEEFHDVSSVVAVGRQLSSHFPLISTHRFSE